MLLGTVKKYCQFLSLYDENCGFCQVLVGFMPNPKNYFYHEAIYGLKRLKDFYHEGHEEHEERIKGGFFMYRVTETWILT